MNFMHNISLITARNFISSNVHTAWNTAYIINERSSTFLVPRQLQAVLATIEQRHHQPEPDFGRSEHNPRCIAATDQVIPDLASHA